MTTKVLAVEATTTSSSSTAQSFTQNDVIPPNKKNETQPQFKPTTKKPGRRATGTTLR